MNIFQEDFALHSPFRIARGVKTAASVVRVVVQQGKAVGQGECVPYARYGENPESVEAQLQAVKLSVEAGVTRQELQRIMPAGAARNALDCALWDLEAAKAATSVWQLAGLPAPVPQATAITISADIPEKMHQAALQYNDALWLKIKATGEADREKIMAVRRAAPHAALIIDANEGWSIAQLEELTPFLVENGVGIVEQPLPEAQDDALYGKSWPFHLCADESCHTTASLDKLLGKYSMVNIKLDKTGGLTEALALLWAARSKKMSVMLGCMVATSLSLMPAMLLASAVDAVDIDGFAWLAQDRACHLRLNKSTVELPDDRFWGDNFCATQKKLEITSHMQY
ncbi:MAG: N-acetyl-D-Glu racemase DgcA [Alphaproteobacteria bacterium]